MTLLPFVYYALLPGSIGYVIVWWAQKGIFNVGTLLVILIAATAAYLIFRYGRAAIRVPETVR
jgi:lactate permease